MNTENYYNLPDGMQEEDVVRVINQLLEEIHPDDSADTIAEIVHEVADRQWHTYQKLDDDLLRKVSFVLTTVWSDHDQDRADKILSSVAMLGATSALNHILARNREAMSPQVRQAISSFVNEVGTDVGDPYSSLR